ncbi:hypothetical protein [Nonomuraea sp. B19D2]|uniref:hypothetical protein n=1 Tax=Nonomuraea sp. B19D2 TaxID=3159561 RepID=UPI0032DACE01
MSFSSSSGLDLRRGQAHRHIAVEFVQLGEADERFERGHRPRQRGQDGRHHTAGGPPCLRGELARHPGQRGGEEQNIAHEDRLPVRVSVFPASSLVVLVLAGDAQLAVQGAELRFTIGHSGSLSW